MRLIKSLVIASISTFVIAAHADNAPSTTAAASTASTAPDISGKYNCTGADSEGKNNYASPVTITKVGDTYNIQWLNSNGYPYNLGTGIFNTNVNNVLSAVFWDPKKPDGFGTIVYQLKSDGSLVGNWVMQSGSGVGTETCKKS